MSQRKASRFRRIGLLALNDLRLTAKDRSAFVWMLVLPLAMMWFFGQAGTGGGDGPPKISLTVDDRDGGWLARALVDELEGDQVALAEAAQSAEDGEETQRLRTLVLEEGLTEKVLAGDTEELRLEVDPDADNTFGQGAEVHVWRSLVRVMGRLLEVETGLAEGEELPAVAEERYAAIAAAPPKVGLAVSTAGEGEPVPQGYAQSVPGILAMTVLMMTLIYGGVFLVIEKQQRMLWRQATLPLDRGEIIAGKLGGRLLIAGLQLVVLFAAGRFLFGLSLGASPVALGAVALCYAVAVAALSVLMGAVLHTPEQASTLGWLASMVLAALGGCWWPGELMPGWLQTVASVLPTTWAMEGFHGVISFGRGLGAVTLPCLVLLGFGALFSIVAARRLELT